MQLDRRLMLTAGLGVGAGMGLSPGRAHAAGQVASGPGRTTPPPPRATGVASASDLGVHPDSGQDETVRLQAAIDRAAERHASLVLAPGNYRVRGLVLRSGTRLIGTAGATVLEHSGASPLIAGSNIARVALDGLVLRASPASGPAPKGLVEFSGVDRLALTGLEVEGARTNAIALERCAGSISSCRIVGAAKAGILSLDAAGLEITHNLIEDCANNGILVWRSAAGEDGTIVTGNRIRRIGAADGGTGQNGNGINVFRAGAVLVSGNRIADCAFSAVRANSASDVEIVSNGVSRMGEVALYAEFAFEGAVIASNLVDRASTGISVTNFNEGGRLAAVTGNLVRNLVARADEPGASGYGISVEADCAVTGNVVEAAMTAGISLGWARYGRDIAATGNVVRASTIGIAVTGDSSAGAILIADNMISGATRGAIRAFDRGRATGPDLSREAVAFPRLRLANNLVA